MRPKYYFAEREKDGRKIIVVGKWRKKKQQREIVEEIIALDDSPHQNCKLVSTQTVLEYSLTLGLAICHPEDEFTQAEGARIALRRIKNGESLGKLATFEYTMLTPDNCQMIVDHKANYIIDNIDKFLPKEQENGE